MSDPRSMAGRPVEKSELLGQVNTPMPIAMRMVLKLFTSRPQRAIRILDACVGPFTFPVAMAKTEVLTREDLVTAIDIDPAMILQREKRPELQSIGLECAVADYIDLQLGEKYDFAIMNPPYVRQEWLDAKDKYQATFSKHYQIDVPGTSNLYVYFIAKVIQDLRLGGRFAIIVYDSWQSTLYGRWLIEYLSSTCETIEFETIPGQPFGDRLIDATILYGTKGARSYSKTSSYNVSSSFVPKTQYALRDIAGFASLEECFSTYRGLRLKQANFFLCQLDECEKSRATPFLKKVAKLQGLYHVPDAHPEAALLLTPGSDNSDKKIILAVLRERLRAAQKDPDNNVSILTWFNSQPETWYIHRKAPRAPLVFNYYLRNRPRHIYNPKRVYSDNFYGLTPLRGDVLAWLAVLNSTAVCAEIMARSRNQGNGLAKIQLFEYRDVRVPAIQELDRSDQKHLKSLGQHLIENPSAATDIVAQIDEFLFKIYGDMQLKPLNIRALYQELSARARKPKE